MNGRQHEIKVALYGYGTVGEAVARFLLHQTDVLREKSGVRITLAYIIDRDPSSITLGKPGAAGATDKSGAAGATDKPGAAGGREGEGGINADALPAGGREGDADALPRQDFVCSDDHELPLRDPDVRLIIELIGGVEAARALCNKALRAGKHIVTANKALIAEHGAELCAGAHERGLCIAFEASCGGAIPILRALYGGLISNRIDALYAIINGTCNYILTKMTYDGADYATALREAQRLGFAEADPALDVGGGDSAHKLAIMTTLAYGYRVSYADINTVGITDVQLADIKYGKQLDLHLKLVAMSIRYQDTFIATVRPTFLSFDHPLQRVHGAYNAVSVYGNASGHTLFYGQGAGGKPTASAVIADIIGVSSGEIPTAFSHYSNWPDTSQTPQMASWLELTHRYYMRLVVRDRPGMLGKIANVLAEEQLSIASIHQNAASGATTGSASGATHRNEAGSASHATASGATAPDATASDSEADVVVTLHVAKESQVMSAVERLKQIADRVYHIPILDEKDDAVE